MVRWLDEATGAKARLIKAGYQLDGTPIGDYETSFFIAPFGVAAMLKPSEQAFLDSIYAEVYDRHEDYYEDSVTLICLLIMTGNYWKPTGG